MQCPSVTSCRRLRAGAVPAPRRPRGAQQPKAPARTAPPSSRCPAAAMTGRGGGAAGGGRDPAGPPPLRSAPLPLPRPPRFPGRFRGTGGGGGPGAVLARPAWAWRGAVEPGALAGGAGCSPGRLPAGAPLGPWCDGPVRMSAGRAGAACPHCGSIEVKVSLKHTDVGCSSDFFSLQIKE